MYILEVKTYKKFITRNADSACTDGKPQPEKRRSWLDLLTLRVRTLKIRRAGLKVGAVLLVPDAKAGAKVMHTDILVMIRKGALAVCAILVMTDFIQPIPKKNKKMNNVNLEKIFKKMKKRTCSRETCGDDAECGFELDRGRRKCWKCWNRLPDEVSPYHLDW